MGSAFRGFLRMFLESFGSCGNSTDASMLVREPNKHPTAKISNQTDLHTEILTTMVKLICGYHVVSVECDYKHFCLKH